MDYNAQNRMIRKTYNFSSANQKQIKKSIEISKILNFSPNLNPHNQLSSSIREMQLKIEGFQTLFKKKSNKSEISQNDSQNTLDIFRQYAVKQQSKTKNWNKIHNYLQNAAQDGIVNISELNPNSPPKKFNRLHEPDKYIGHPQKFKKIENQSKSFMDLPQVELEQSFIQTNNKSFIQLLSQQQSRKEIKLLTFPEKQDNNKQIRKKQIDFVNLMETIKQIKSRSKPQVNSKNRIIDQFQLGKVLGRGKFGQVYMAKHIVTGFIVAIKKVAKKQLQQHKMVGQFIKEIKLHSTLDHPNIVKFYGFFQQKDSIYLVLEYLSGGTLFQYQNEVGVLPIKQAANFLKDVIEGLVYLHDKSIAHRDIKPQNIVISSTGIAKLCDFGWSVIVHQLRDTFCGTLDYAPPEIIEGKKYDTTVDLWCIGILTYELLIGKAPFQSQNRNQVMSRIANIDKTGLPVMSEIPEEAKDFIQALLQKDPSLRPPIYQLLNFPLFSHANNSFKHKNVRSYIK